MDQVEGQGLTGLWAKELLVRKDPPRGEKIRHILRWAEGFGIRSVLLKCQGAAVSGHGVVFWLHRSLWAEKRRNRRLCLTRRCVLLSAAVIIGWAPGSLLRAIYSENLVFRI